MKLSTFSKSKIDHFEQVFGEAHLIFACQAAVPLIFSADFLYKLWLNFNTYPDADRTKKIPHWAVSDLILSGFCQPVGFDLYKLETGIRLYLLQLLIEKTGVERQQQIAAFLQQFAEKYYAGSEKNIQEIHLLTAASILDPAGMEQQISSQLQEKIGAGDKDVVNLLTLYFNLAHETGDGNTSENRIILVEENDPLVPGYLNIRLPDFLQTRVQPLSTVSVEEEPEQAEAVQEPSYAKALAIVEEFLVKGEGTLYLDHCGLTDADFVEGGPLDSAVRKCKKARALVLSNEWYGLNGNYRRPLAHHKGPKNFLGHIPSCVAALTSLSAFLCGGEADNPWAIRQIGVLKKLKRIKRLHLPNNRIDDLTALESLPELVELDLGNNQIRDIKSLERLTKLKQLDLRNNKIESIRPLQGLIRRYVISEEGHLNLEAHGDFTIYYPQTICLFGNPLRNPPSEVVKQGLPAILQYWEYGTKPQIVKAWVCQTWKEHPEQFDSRHIFKEPTADSFCPLQPGFHGILIEEELPVAEAGRIQDLPTLTALAEGMHPDRAFLDIGFLLSDILLNKVCLLYDFATDHDHPALLNLISILRELRVDVELLSPNSTLAMEEEAIERNQACILLYGRNDPQWFMMRQHTIMASPRTKGAVLIAEPNMQLKRDRDIANNVLKVIRMEFLEADLRNFLKDDRYELYQELMNDNFPMGLFRPILPANSNMGKAFWQVIGELTESDGNETKIKKLCGYDLPETIIKYNDLYSQSKPEMLDRGLLSAVEKTEETMDRRFGAKGIPLSSIYGQLSEIVYPGMIKIIRQATANVADVLIKTNSADAKHIELLLMNELERSVELRYYDLKTGIFNVLISRRIEMTRAHGDEEERSGRKQRWQASYKIFTLFISYSREDMSFKQQIIKDLHSRFPLVSVYDPVTVAEGVSRIKIISNMINRSDYFLGIFSDAYANSNTCWDEFQCAKLNEYRSGNQMIIGLKYNILGKDIPPIMSLYNLVNFQGYYANGLEELVQALTEMNSTTLSNQSKNICFICAGGAEDLCNELKDRFKAGGFTVADYNRNNRSDLSAENQLENLRASNYIIILFGTRRPSSKFELDQVRHAIQENKTIELLGDDLGVIPTELRGHHFQPITGNLDIILNTFLEKYPHLVSQQSDQNSTDPDEAPPTDTTPGKIILWVNDRLGELPVDRKFFSDLGIEVVSVLSTRHALASLIHHQYDLIICNIGSAERAREEVYELLHEIRKNGNSTPLLIYGAIDLPEHQLEANKRGVQGSAHNPQGLVRLIRQHLNIASATDGNFG